MKKTPRDYQKEAVDTVLQKLGEGVQRQLIVMATGLGKTYTASLIMKHMEKVLWLTHREELIEQSALSVIKEEWSGTELLDNHINELEDMGTINYLKQLDAKAGETEFEKNFGVIKAERNDLDARIVFASVQSLHRRLDKIDPNHFEMIVVDETHYAMAKTWVKCLDYFTPNLLLGLTATPTRLDGLSLNYLYDEITVTRDIQYGISKKHLCELDAIRIKTRTSLDSVKKIGGDFSTKDMRTLDNPDRNMLILNKYLEYAKDRQAIGFCFDVEHAMNMAETFNLRGVKADFVVGDKKLCPDRKERMKRFKSGKTEVLFNVNILSEGFDHPETACIILARPTMSKALYMQQVGRGTRKKENFDDCIILDIIDNTSKHSLINTWTLEMGVPISKRVFMTSKQKGDVKRQNKMLHHELDGDENVNLFSLPKIKLSNSPKMQEPATPAQLAFLIKVGMWTKDVHYTKGMAAEILSNLPVSSQKAAFLKHHNYDISMGVSNSQYQLAIKEIDARKELKEFNKTSPIIL